MDWKRVYKYTKLKGLDYLQESKNVINMARVFKNESPKKKTLHAQLPICI